VDSGWEYNEEGKKDAILERGQGKKNRGMHIYEDGANKAAKEESHGIHSSDLETPTKKRKMDWNPKKRGGEMADAPNSARKIKKPHIFVRGRSQDSRFGRGVSFRLAVHNAMLARATVSGRRRKKSPGTRRKPCV